MTAIIKKKHANEKKWIIKPINNWEKKLRFPLEVSAWLTYLHEFHFRKKEATKILHSLNLYEWKKGAVWTVTNKAWSEFTKSIVFLRIIIIISVKKEKVESVRTWVKRGELFSTVADESIGNCEK